MKFLPILVLIFVAANALEPEFVEKFVEKVFKIVEVCAEETHANADDVAHLAERKVPSTHEGKCMLFCFQKKFNLMKEDGSLDKVGAVFAIDEIKNEDPDLYRKILNVFVICGEKVKIHDDPCKTSADLYECARDEALAMGVDESLIG